MRTPRAFSSFLALSAGFVLLLTVWVGASGYGGDGRATSTGENGYAGGHDDAAAGSKKGYCSGVSPGEKNGYAGGGQDAQAGAGSNGYAGGDGSDGGQEGVYTEPPYEKPVDGLDAKYYENSCPDMEKNVGTAVAKVVDADASLAATFIRLFFHDFAVGGTDGSILIDVPGQREKYADASRMLRRFEVIEAIKTELEAKCHATVSCADILTAAARDAAASRAVRAPYWSLKYRKGYFSVEKADTDVPMGGQRVTDLIAFFEKNRLIIQDLVALSVRSVVMDLPRAIWPLVFLAAFFIAKVVATKITTRRRQQSVSTAGPTTPKRPPPPPMSPGGVPLLGDLPALLIKGPLDLIRDHYTKLGCVFTVRLFCLRLTFLVGPDVSSHFYRGLDSEISQDEVSQFTIPTFGPGIAFDVDYATRHEQFRFFGDAMKPVKLRTYVSLMVDEVKSHFARWGESGTVDLKQELEHLVTLITSRCLFGAAVREKMFGEVGQLLRELNDGMRLVTILFPHLPIPAHRRRDAARARLGEIFTEIVRSRKESRRTDGDGGDADDDMLQCLLDARYKDGRGTTETEVVGMLVAALFAGQHNSSSVGTWTGARLLTHTTHLRAAVEEQRRVVSRHGDSVVDYDALQEMDTLHRCVKETLRLHPPALMLLRHARRSFTVRTGDGREYEVPQGHAVASPLVLHNRLPHVYEEPDKYDPGRFAPRRRAEDKAAAGALAYMSFGAGRHQCVGEAFAYMQLKLIWSYLLRHFEMELVSPFPRTDWNVVMPGPHGKVIISYKRRHLT